MTWSGARGGPAPRGQRLLLLLQLRAAEGRSRSLVRALRRLRRRPLRCGRSAPRLVLPAVPMLQDLWCWMRRTMTRLALSLRRVVELQHWRVHPRPPRAPALCLPQRTAMPSCNPFTPGCQ